jgi:hypothetical protein
MGIVFITKYHKKGKVDNYIGATSLYITGLSYYKSEPDSKKLKSHVKL